MVSNRDKERLVRDNFANAYLSLSGDAGEVISIAKGKC